MKALLYLRLWKPIIEEFDLTKLEFLRRVAVDAGYTITEARIVHDPDDADDAPQEWTQSRQDLKDGRFDVIVLWHEDLGTPDTITRDDLNVSRRPLETP